MSEDLEHLHRILKLRIKYAMGKAQGQILDSAQLEAVAEKIRQGQDAAATNEEIKKLTLAGVNKAGPVMRELVTELTQEYARAITEVISQTVLEMVVTEIERAAKGKPGSTPDSSPPI